MIKRVTIAAALAALSTTARADDDVGVELGHTLVGVRGPGARISLGAVELDAVVQGYLFDSDPQLHRFAGEVRALVPVRRFDDGWLGVAGGVAIAHESDGGLVSGLPPAGWGLGLEAGLHAEWYPMRALSLGFDVGVADLRGLDGARLPFVDVVDADTRAAALGRPTGGATLTYWFGAPAGDAPAAPSSLRVGVGVVDGTEAPGLTADLGLGRFLVEGSLQVERWTSASDTRLAFASIAGLGEVARRGRVALLAGLRVATYSQDPDVTGAQRIVPVVSAPLRIQVDVTSWLSLHAETALELFRIEPGATYGGESIPPASLDGGFTVWL